MPLKTLREFFEAHRIPFKIIHHVQAFTAQEIAASAHIPGRQMAKTVMVKIDGTMTMAVLPASYRVDIDRKQLFMIRGTAIPNHSSCCSSVDGIVAFSMA